MKVEIDPRLPSSGGLAALLTRLYELFRIHAQAINRRAEGFVMPSQVVSATYTMQIGDCVVLMSAAGGARTVTLPSPAQAVGKLLAIRKTEGSANNVTVSPPSGTIDGAASLTLTAASPRVTVVSDGTNYFSV